MASDFEQKQVEDPTITRLDAAYSFRWAEAMEELGAALDILDADGQLLGPPGIVHTA
jgi:hypothetical protein